MKLWPSSIEWLNLFSQSTLHSLFHESIIYRHHFYHCNYFYIRPIRLISRTRRESARNIPSIPINQKTSRIRYVCEMVLTAMAYCGSSDYDIMERLYYIVLAFHRLEKPLFSNELEFQTGRQAWLIRTKVEQRPLWRTAYDRTSFAVYVILKCC